MSQAVGTEGLSHRTTPGLLGVGRFVLTFLQLQIAMTLGAVVCYLLGRVISASSTYAAVYYPGSYLYSIGDLFFLAGPPAAWMLYRVNGKRQPLELAVAMLAPVVAIAILGELTGRPYLLWLVTGMYPAMTVGMLAYVFYRSQTFATGRSKRGARSEAPSRPGNQTSGKGVT